MKTSMLRAAPAALGLVYVSIGACRGPSQRTASQVPQSPVVVESSPDASLAISAPDAPTEKATAIDEAVARVLGDPVATDDAGANEAGGPPHQRGRWDGGCSVASSVEPLRRAGVGQPCKKNDDCTRGALCGFPGSAHCAARGTCLR